MLEELSEDINSIKKIQSVTKETLTEINNLQGNNSRVDEAKNQKSMIWNIREQKKTNQNNKKKKQSKKTKTI